MMSDLIERLRSCSEDFRVEYREAEGCSIYAEAAAEIERLTAENKHVTLLYNASLKSQDKQQAEIERLRAALERIANDPGGHPDSGEPLRDIAREALK